MTSDWVLWAIGVFLGLVFVGWRRHFVWMSDGGVTLRVIGAFLWPITLVVFAVVAVMLMGMNIIQGAMGIGRWLAKTYQERKHEKAKKAHQGTGQGGTEGHNTGAGL